MVWAAAESAASPSSNQSRGSSGKEMNQTNKDPHTGRGDTLMHNGDGGDATLIGGGDATDLPLTGANLCDARLASLVDCTT